jgi:hypothetical protein
LFCLRADLPALARVVVTLFPPAGARFFKYTQSAHATFFKFKSLVLQLLYDGNVAF